MTTGWSKYIEDRILGMLSDKERHVAEVIADATIKNGFVGPMNKHSARMQNYRTLNLDPGEWRRT